MMYVVLCVCVVLACLLNVFVWCVCDLLCGVAWSVYLSLLFFLCGCVLCCSIVRLNVLFVMCCVMLYGVFLLCCCACVFSVVVECLLFGG